MAYTIVVRHRRVRRSRVLRVTWMTCVVWGTEPLTVTVLRVRSSTRPCPRCGWLRLRLGGGRAVAHGLGRPGPPAGGSWPAHFGVVQLLERGVVQAAGAALGGGGPAWPCGGRGAGPSG